MSTVSALDSISFLPLHWNHAHFSLVPQLLPVYVQPHFQHDCHNHNNDNFHYKIFFSENTRNTISSTLIFCNYIQFFSQLKYHPTIYKLMARLKHSCVRYATKMKTMSLWWCFILKNSRLFFSWMTSWMIMNPKSFMFRTLADHARNFIESFRISFQMESDVHSSWNCSRSFGSPWPLKDASWICRWVQEKPTKEQFNNFRFIV